MDRLSEIRARCVAVKAEKDKGSLVDCASLAYGMVKVDIPYLLAEVEGLQVANCWIPVEERLPENETSVLICATRKFEDREIRIVSKAIHTDGEHNTETSSLLWDSGDMDWEHDETADADIIPEGWWEDVNYLEQFAAVDDFVTHWRPLPEPPKKGERGWND